ncbi:MAG: Mur ligase domain-containing protein [candidate division SR1 bacterium]|nr:Mur ligase domain-containing protein [candidate division SR1 bacterium]
MNIVLVGAGGTGMSGIAGILNDLGYTNLVCIDGTQSELTDKLKAKGLKVIIGHGKYKVQLGDAVIYSEAVAECEEVREARKIMKANQKVMVILNYFQFLGEVSKYFISIGFAGTNGKSSSTALAIHTGKKLLPNFGLGILGALVPGFETQSYVINKKAKNDIKTIFDYIFTGKNPASLGTNSSSLIKKRSFFVESCEYKRHFLYLDLNYTIITSLELDHTDYYKDMKDYVSAYETFISRIKTKVLVPKGMKTKVTSFDKLLTSSKMIKEVPIKPIPFTHIRGKHNDVNGALTLELMTRLCKEPKTKILSTMKTFGGLRRRMEYLTTNENGAKIFTDYGHMASSIEFGYMALKHKFPGKKLSVIFQPHQINRIVTGRKDFVKTLNKYDTTIIYDIYAARENLQELIKKIPTRKGIKNIQQLGASFAEACGGKYIDTFESISKIIQQAEKNSIVVIYSAGDIDYKLRNYLKK